MQSRVIDEETEICGYQIPAKVQVHCTLRTAYHNIGTLYIFQTHMMYSTYTSCRDPKYVEDPTSFKPERWARDTPTNEELDAFLSLSFGFGPRSCYGNAHKDHTMVN